MIKKISSAIFKTFLLSLMVIVDLHFAFAQSTQQGIIPNGKATFLDQNGKPVTAGTVDFYIPGTTTRKTTYQDINGTIANTNPVVLDAAGRALLWGTGSYRQVVKDFNGNLIWDVTTSSAGGASGGGGGSATGDGDLIGTIKPWAGMTPPNQYMFTYGQELSRTTYAALFNVITSTQGAFCTTGSPLITGIGDTSNFWVGMKVEINCVPAGVTTIVSKTPSTVTLAVNSNITTNTNAIFYSWGNGNGTTTFNLPDFRGVVPMGNNIMGGVSSANINSTYFGNTNPNSSGALGGNQSAVLGLTNLPTGITSSNASQGVSVNSTVSDIVRSSVGTSSFSGSVGGSLGMFASSTGNTTQIITSTGNNSISVTSNNTGSSGTAVPFSQIQPSRTVNFIIKVTPDANSAIANGVTDVNGMTGSIGCGAGISCVSNSIALNIICGGGITCSGNTITSTIQTVSPSQYGAVCNNIVDDTSAINLMYSSIAVGSTIQFPNSLCKILGSVIIGTSSTTIIPSGGGLNSTGNGYAINIQANNVSLSCYRGASINGPRTPITGNTYLAGNSGIFINGTIGTTRTGIKISGCTITNFQEAGIWSNYCTFCNFDNNTSTFQSYAGILCVVCIDSGANGNIIDTIASSNGPGSSTLPAGTKTNAYGITFTTDALGNFSSNSVISNNVVNNVPTWQCLDSHAGQSMSFVNNVCTNTRAGISITTDGLTFASNNTIVNGNKISCIPLNQPIYPGGPSISVGGPGIYAPGISGSPSNNNMVLNNIISSCGSSETAQSPQASILIGDATNFKIEGNSIVAGRWAGIELYGASIGTVKNNNFSGLIQGPIGTNNLLMYVATTTCQCLFSGNFGNSSGSTGYLIPTQTAGWQVALARDNLFFSLAALHSVGDAYTDLGLTAP